MNCNYGWIVISGEFLITSDYNFREITTFNKSNAILEHLVSCFLVTGLSQTHYRLCQSWPSVKIRTFRRKIHEKYFLDLTNYQISVFVNRLTSIHNNMLTKFKNKILKNVFYEKWSNFYWKNDCRSYIFTNTIIVSSVK